MFVLVTLLLQTFAASQSDCPRFVCGTEGQDFAQDQCILWESEIQTYWLKPCTDPTKSYCRPVSDKAINVFCTDPLPPARTPKYPGESCHGNNDCDTSKTPFGCVDGRCRGQIKGGLCKDSSECDPSLYCLSGSCSPQIKVGSSGCLDDTDCVNNAVCDSEQLGTVEGTCVEAYSGKPGSSLKSCQPDTRLCASGQCVSDPQPKCLDFLKSEGALPVVCSSASDCVSISDARLDQTYTSECECGYNAKGKKLCGLHSGDPTAKAYLTKVREWSRSEEIRQCNTVRRYALDCIQDMWEQEEYLEYAYRYWSYKKYTQLAFNDACVKRIYELEYYILQEEYNHAQEPEDEPDDWADRLLCGAALLGLLQ